MNQTPPNIAVLIPCYNEERSIIAVIDEVRGIKKRKFLALLKRDII